MRVIDLFCGCGGLSLGFQNAGMEICAAFDNWQPAANVYRCNFSDHPVYEYDLGSDDLDMSLLAAFQPDIVIGGPPCQDFSSAGKRDESQGRADLTKKFAIIVACLLPKWFVMENVDRTAKSKLFTQASEILKGAGYGVTQVILDASLCGVPQTRKRLFLIGEIEGKDDALKPYLLKNLADKPMTLRDYFGNKLGVEFYYRHPRSYARRAVFSIDEPSPTVRGVNRPVPSTYQSHAGDVALPGPDLRPLTTKERSMIQTFPENFVWLGGKADLEQMIGNAVPVKLAEYVARCILKYMRTCPVGESKRDEPKTDHKEG